MWLIATQDSPYEDAGDSSTEALEDLRRFVQDIYKRQDGAAISPKTSIFDVDQLRGVRPSKPKRRGF